MGKGKKANSKIHRLTPFLANTNKRWALKTIRKSIRQQPPPEPPAEKILRLTGLDIAHCPKCKTRLIACPLPIPKRPP